LQQSLFAEQAVPTWKQAPPDELPLELELLELLEPLDPLALAELLDPPELELAEVVALLGLPLLLELEELETLPLLLELLELELELVLWVRQSASSCTQVPFTQESPKQPCGSQSS
jgi:hypothetical protein